MNYSRVLALVIERKNIDVEDLANQMYISKDWIAKILKTSRWKPNLDTILHFCYCLDFNSIQFFKLCQTRKFNKLAKQLHSNTKNHREHCKLILHLRPKHVARAFLFFREKTKFTQKELSLKTNFQISSISFRESVRYDSMPTMETIQLYCIAFSIKIDTFIEKIFHFAQIDRLKIPAL